MSNAVLLIDGLPPVTIFHAKRKTIGLKFTRFGTFELRTSSLVSEETLHQFILKNSLWMRRMVKRHAQHTASNAHENELFFRGKWYQVEHDPSLFHLCAEVENTLYFAGDQTKRHLTILRWLKIRANDEIPKRVLMLADQYQYRSWIKILRITDTQTRWGSCSSRGTLSFSWRLILMPDYVRDYIIVHELAHFSQMNHSPKFWQTVAQLAPDYELAEQWLKEKSHLLHQSTIIQPSQ